MKKAAFIGMSILAASIALTGCMAENKTDQETVSLDETIYKDTVRLNTAQNYIQNYVRTCDKYLGDTVPIRSYTINKSDLFGVLGVTSVPKCQYEHCRVYIGLDNFNKFKLYMTPTVKRANPVTPGDSIYVDTIPYDRINKKYFVYDLNAPCPSTCDTGSKLYVKGK